MTGSETERHLRLLLADDDPADVFMIREILSELALNITLDVVEDGIAAMAFLQRRPPYEQARRPDMVLLDLNMPRMDGRKVLKAIRADQALADLPVLILTTSEAHFDINTCYESGGNAYFHKPFGMDPMMDLLQKIGYFWGELAMLPSDG